MTVYIGIPFRRFGSYTMIADTDEELHRMAMKLELAGYDHGDYAGSFHVSKAGKNKALHYGAIVLDHETYRRIRTYLTWLKNAA